MHETEALRRAVALGARGPLAGGNPRVGCVLLDADGDLLAEGWHRGAGTAHAEVAALAAVPPGRRHRLAGATAVVTLEPCAHTGRTPPCTEALLAAGLRRVLYAVPDPDPVAAGGADWLRARGVEALTAASAGVAPAAVAAAEDLVQTWASAVRRRRPWVVAKSAATLDGRVTAADGTSKWITAAAAREHAHGERARTDAIVVGTGTVLADDPALTARPADGLPAHQPLRVVVGHRPVPPGARLRQGPGQWQHQPTRDLGVVLDRLYRGGARRVLLEGGPTLVTAALRADLVDEIHLYLAPLLLGAGTPVVGDLGARTLTQARRWRPHRTERVGEDLFLALRRPPEPVVGGSTAARTTGELDPAEPTADRDRPAVATVGGR